MPKNSKLTQYYTPLLIIVAILACANVVNMVNRAYTDATWGGFDLHPYWYFGHFVWEGTNPYRAFAQQLTPQQPKHYLDGVTATANDAIFQAGLGDRPANTAPMILAVSALSLFSWPVAKTIWLIVNIVCIILIPHLITRLVPHELPVPTRLKTLLALLFLAYSSARWTGIYGQTSLIVFSAMLGAVVLPRKWWPLAGILLGFALSKYSIAIAAFVYLLIQRRWRVIAVAALTQLAALAFVANLDDTTILQTLEAYWWFATQHADDGGVHLAASVENQTAALVAAVACTGVLAAFLWRFRPHINHPKQTQQQRGVANLQLFAILILWSLLSVYHLQYDMVMTIVCVLLAFVALLYPDIWRLSQREQTALLAATLVFVALHTVPRALLRPILFIPSLRGTFALLLLLAITGWLTYRWAIHSRLGDGA